MKFRRPTLFRFLCFILLVLESETNSTFSYGPNERDICDALEYDAIISIRPMKEVVVQDGKKYSASHEVSLITLKSGIKGVYKIQKECEIYAEMAAYKASCFMGFSFVPPTVTRVINGKLGSMQLYVKTNTDVIGSQFNETIALVPADDLANLKIFLYIFGQHDAVPHNMLLHKVNSQAIIFAIDNGCMCTKKYWQYGKNPFIIVPADYSFPTQDERAFPYAQYTTIPNNNPDELKRVFGSIFTDEYYKKKLSKYHPFRYICYKHHLWVQKRVDAPVFCYTTHYPLDTIEKIRKLNKQDLRQIFLSFHHTLDDSFVDDDFLDAILDRRDQVLAHYEQVKGIK